MLDCLVVVQNLWLVENLAACCAGEDVVPEREEVVVAGEDIGIVGVFSRTVRFALGGQDDEGDYGVAGGAGRRGEVVGLDFG